MKKSLGLISIVILVSFILASVPFGVNAQDNEIPVWKKMRYLSEEEMYLPVETGKDFVRSDPPPTPVYNIAEFDYMEGVLIRYPFGIPYTLIAEMSEDIMVTTIVTGESQEVAVRNLYGNNGVNLDNCNFMHAPSDSYWTRDYGPWYIIDGNYEVGIVNFVYNRPRPSDNNIPVKTSEFLNIPLYAMTLITAGGNYMTDGYGNASSSDLIWDENPEMTPEEIDEMLYEYCGIENNHVLLDPLAEYIKHIDCWGKFLGVNKVLIGEVPSFDPRYDDFEYIADYFASHLSGWGMPWEVFRVYTPGNYPYTPYTNSLILNNKVLVPITGSQWDDEALQVYEDAMPGYEVVGVYAGSSGWQNTDALHCRAKGIADREMLWVRHMPYFGNVAQQEEFEVESTIIPLSGEALYPDSLLVYYKIDDGDWEFVTMTTEDDTTFTGLIPGPEPGSDISYYIHAADESGKSANHPIPAASDPHVFEIQMDYNPNISIYPEEIQTTTSAGTIIEESFKIYNLGNLDLEFEITHTVTIYDDYDYIVSDSPDGSTWTYNTFEELNWASFWVDESGEISNWKIDYSWFTPTPGVANVGTFWIESPSGTVGQILGNGSVSGDIEKELSDFNGETMQGLWNIWIEDANGGGGHEASDILITITRATDPGQWLTVNPMSGIINPTEDIDIQVICDATQLEDGIYNGEIYISSNDPDEPEIMVPVIFDVTGLPDITVLPTSIEFLDYQQMIEGIPVMVYNFSEENVVINDINQIGLVFMWYVDPYGIGINLPYELNAGDSLELNIMVDLPVSYPGVILTDTMFIQTNANIHKVLINIDSDLIYAIRENNTFADVHSFPNPFSDQTNIHFTTTQPGNVKIDIFNQQGQKIRSLMNQELGAGQHQVQWETTTDNGTLVPDGIYLYMIHINNEVIVRKIILIK